MFRVIIQDIEKFADLHESTVKSLHKIDKRDTETATNFIRKSLRRIFNTEGFGTWDDLNEKYEKWKEKNYPGQSILRLEDDYYFAATRKGHPGNVLEQIGRKSDDFYSIAYTLNDEWFKSGPRNFFYPGTHEQEGGTAIRRADGSTFRVPERPVFRLAENDAALRADILRLYRLNVAKKLSNFHKGFGESLIGKKGISEARRDVLVDNPEGLGVGQNDPF